MRFEFQLAPKVGIPQKFDSFFPYLSLFLYFPIHGMAKTNQFNSKWKNTSYRSIFPNHFLVKGEKTEGYRWLWTMILYSLTQWPLSYHFSVIKESVNQIFQYKLSRLSSALCCRFLRTLPLKVKLKNPSVIYIFLIFSQLWPAILLF